MWQVEALPTLASKQGDLGFSQLQRQLIAFAYFGSMINLKLTLIGWQFKQYMWQIRFLSFLLIQLAILQRPYE
jgi:hypothetical protein